MGKVTLCTVKGCRNEGRYCRLHLSFSVPTVAVINKKSDNQKDLNKKFAKAKREYLKEHPICEAMIEGCTKVSIDVHHKAGKASEELLLDKSLFLGVCRHCHTIIEKNPAFAKQQGFSVSRLSKRA
jgi:MinD superfamily P-loop ATPase